LYLGGELLHYDEEKIFSMTLRKFYLLYDEYLEYHGMKKKSDEGLLDSL